MKYHIVVLRQPGSRQWGVYETSSGYNRLLEGGFFSKDAAVVQSIQWENELRVNKGN
jgi:hypothetical protein